MAGLAILLCLPSKADDSDAVDLPTSKRDLLEVMMRMLGDDRVSIEERGLVQDLIIRTDDRRDLIEALLRHVDDDRTFDPAMEVPCGNGVKARYSVGDQCDSMLRSKFKIPLRSKYQVGAWKDWWKKNSGRRFEDIWKEVEAADHD